VFVPPAPGLDGEPTSAPDTILAGTVNAWSKIWKATASKPAGRGYLTSAASSELPPRTVEEFAFRTKAFKTAVLDVWHPGRLPLPAVDRVLRLLHASEVAGRLPPSCREAVVRTIPNPRGGFRPIALFRALYRVWGKARTPLLAAWSKSLVTVVFTMAPQRRISDGFCRECCRYLLGQASCRFVIEVHLDVATFFGPYMLVTVRTDRCHDEVPDGLASGIVD
jgi:hypothetical protein